MELRVLKNTFNNIGDIKKKLDDDFNINLLLIDSIKSLSEDFDELKKFISFCFARKIQIYNEENKLSLITDKGTISTKFYTDVLINSNFEHF